MAGASFVQSSFLGGVWSSLCQGRMETQDYKEGLNRMFNAFPLETGAWTRRPGFRFLAHTKGGVAGRLMDFDFDINTPYQMEFTNGYLRFYQGRSLVTTVQDVELTEVSTDNPARVYLGQDLPSGWANGGTVIFDIKSTPCSAPKLCNRQFIIRNVSGNTFTLEDALTGEAIDGADIAYQTPGPESESDGVQLVFELTTPYTDSEWLHLRTVQDIDNILLLHSDFKPRIIREATTSVTPFTIATREFLDGPYYDINQEDTTMALSGLTGSVTVTMSDVVGVNNDTGFQSTDVGRLLRYQAAPEEWDVGTPYAKGAIVLASDNNIYKALLPTTGSDPATDDGTNWEITDQTVVWTWLKISAVGTTLSATADILGPDIPSSNATTVWRIGIFSDTTGWPSCGEYHEGRLWVAGNDSNRVDGSKSNDPFNFSPTASDGTVADDNAVAAVANARGKNRIFWLLSTEDGLIAGTQAGEWRVRASATDDPISPTTTQFRRVSTLGCADIEPVQAAQTVFVQRQKRKIMAHVRANDDNYFGENLSITADSLTVDGLEEVVWQPEPNLNIWARRADGTLVGCMFKKAQSSYALKSLHSIWGQSAVGWHEHEHGGGRIFVSISAGPSYDGLSDTLYAVTVHPDDEDEIHFVEMLMPIFDDQQLDWANSFVDAGCAPCCAQIFSTENDPPDAFDGIRLWGATYLEGQTVVPIVNGLDLGDRVVQAGGYVDIPFGSDPEGKWTLAFFNTIDQDTEYGAFRTITVYVETPADIVPAIDHYAMTTHIGPDADGVDSSYNGVCLVDQFYNNLNDLVYQIQLDSGAITAGIRKLDGPTGLVESHKSEADVMGISPLTFASVCGSMAVLSPGPFNGDGEPGEGWIIMWGTNGGSSNSLPLIRINAGTLEFIDSFGVNDSAFTPDLDHIPAPRTSAVAVRAGAGHGHGVGRFEDFIAYGGLASGSKANWVIVVWLGENGMDLTGANLVTGTGVDDVDVCTGDWIGADRHGVGTFIACGHPRYGAPEANSWYFFEFTVRRVNDAANTLSRRAIGSIAPSDVDATWTNFADFSGVMYDNYDRNIMFFARTTDAVTTKYYLVKINRLTGAIIWKIALDDGNIEIAGFDNWNPQNAGNQFINGSFALLNTTALGTDRLFIFDTINGTLSYFNVNTGHVCSGMQYWQPFTASLTLFGSYTDAGSPDPDPLGQWLANGHPNFTSKWHRIFFGQPTPVPPYPETQVTEYQIPTSLGFNYYSEGQLLRPDFGADAGPQNGPAFAKKRRLHWYGASFYRTKKVSIGVTFEPDTQGSLKPITFKSAGGIPLPAPVLFTGIVSDTINSDYNFEGQIAWRTTRPYNCTVTAMGGFIASTDK